MSRWTGEQGRLKKFYKLQFKRECLSAKYAKNNYLNGFVTSFLDRVLFLSAFFCRSVFLAKRLAQFFKALEIGVFVGRSLVPLCLPEGFSKAVHHGVFGGVGGALLADDGLIQRLDAIGTIGADLFVQGDVHAHVQEGVDLAEVWQVLPVQSGFISSRG